MFYIRIDWQSKHVMIWVINCTLQLWIIRIINIASTAMLFTMKKGRLKRANTAERNWNKRTALFRCYTVFSFLFGRWYIISGVLASTRQWRIEAKERLIKGRARKSHDRITEQMLVVDLSIRWVQEAFLLGNWPFPFWFFDPEKQSASRR